MAEELESWVKNNKPRFDKLSLKKQSYDFFFRDAMRATFYDPNTFYSPADGVIIYQKVVRPDEELLDEKGKYYCLNDLLQEEIPDQNYWVIGVFMTEIDIHINRCPTDGLLKRTPLPPVSTHNLPMIFMEMELFTKYKLGNYEYLYNNERAKNKITHSHYPLKYWVVQIADLDVNMICPFNQNNPAFFKQCDRFSMIRWGSQVDLIVPELDGFNMKFEQKLLHHVEAGVDCLLRIDPK